MLITLYTLGLALRALRLLRHMTLVQVAASTGLSVSFLSGIETDKSQPSLTTLRKLAACYEESLHIIIPTYDPATG